MANICSPRQGIFVADMQSFQISSNHSFDTKRQADVLHVLKQGLSATNDCSIYIKTQVAYGMFKVVNFQKVVSCPMTCMYMAVESWHVENCSLTPAARASKRSIRYKDKKTSSSSQKQARNGKSSAKGICKTLVEPALCCCQQIKSCWGTRSLVGLIRSTAWAILTFKRIAKVQKVGDARFGALECMLLLLVGLESARASKPRTHRTRFNNIALNENTIPPIIIVDFVVSFIFGIITCEVNSWERFVTKNIVKTPEVTWRMGFGASTTRIDWATVTFSPQPPSFVYLF